jgi:mannose-6-phosphate isomerase-like protein (cupin superfamily)
MSAAPPVLALQGDEGERLSFAGVTTLVRVTSEASGGAFSLFEEVPPLLDTPLHVHRDEDELFYVLEGQHVYRVGDKEYTVGPGGLVFAPRGIPHAQRRVVSGEGRQLVVTTPGGFEGFFRELAAVEGAGTIGPEAYAAASERFSITWL